jgi:NAD(P)H-dependent flavin oxidoreductase YrpB (nitropropane dioxygenase family)
VDAADLRVFEAVARLASMSRAAAELNTVQSNVTARIRLLETELGLTRPLRSAAAKQGRAEFLSLWAGQGVRLARRLSAADLVARLAEEMAAAASRLHASG